MSIAELLSRVIQTLGSLTLTGADNWDKALGCIQTLEQIRDQLDKFQKQTEEVVGNGSAEN